MFRHLWNAFWQYIEEATRERDQEIDKLDDERRIPLLGQLWGFFS